MALWSSLRPLCHRPFRQASGGQHFPPEERLAQPSPTSGPADPGSLSASRQLAVPPTTTPPFSPFLWLWLCASLSALIFLGSPLNIDKKKKKKNLAPFSLELEGPFLSYCPLLSQAVPYVPCLCHEIRERFSPWSQLFLLSKPLHFRASWGHLV